MPKNRPQARLSSPPSSGYISLEDAAAYLDVTTRTIRRWIAAGTLTGYRISPRVIRLSKAELDAYIASTATNRWEAS